MRRFPIFVTALGLAISFSTLMTAESTYRISVAVDETTVGDLSLISAAVLDTPEGETPRSLRKLAAGAAGELTILAAQRIDSNGRLTLDDGSLVQLAVGDRIEVVQSCTTSTACGKSGVQIRWKEDGAGPACIFISTGGSVVRSIDFSTHPPTLGIKCL